MSTIGERVKKRREMLGMTQEELADKLGYKSRSSINKLEMGINDITQSKVAEYAKALNTSVAYLMGWDDNYYTYPNIIPYVQGVRIPIVGIIPAGSPVLAAENIEGYDFADVDNASDYFYLRVKGDSMINAGICDNDLVLVKQQSSAENGNIVVCLVNGDEATLKRFYRHGSTVLLQPENPAYAPLIVPCRDFDDGAARIIGLAKLVKHNL